MPANKFALLRYRIIDRCIRNKGSKAYPSKEDLRFACEEALYGSDGEHISMSTLDKDIWAMRNEGELGYYAPIKFSKEHGGYYYENPDFTIAEVPLNDEDLNAIRAAAETLYQFREIPLFKQFDSAIEKILDRMKISAADEEKRESEIIQFEQAGDYKGSEFLQPLFKACSDQKQIQLEYQKFSSKESKRYSFHPYILKEYRNRWYVIGLDDKEDKLRTFSLDRITNVEVSDASFEKSTSFDSKSFFENAFGITVTNSKPENIVLRFKREIAPYILTQPLHHSQKVIHENEDFIDVSLKILVTNEVVTTILSYGKHVQVIEPDLLKSNVMETLNKCLIQYKSNS